MSHLGGHQLVDGRGRRDTAMLPRARVWALRLHVVLPLERTAVSDDVRTVAPPPPSRRRGLARAPRHISTYTFVLTMFVSVAKVAACWQPGLQVVQPSLGSERIAEAPECPDYPPLPVTPKARRFTADLRGDGCEVPVSWDGTTVRFRLDPDARRTVAFEFYDDDEVPLHGRLLLGDWDCDGTDSPALYLPTTGEIVSFDHLGERSGAVRRLAGRSGVREGDAWVRRGRDGCDEVEIRPAA